MCARGGTLSKDRLDGSKWLSNSRAIEQLMPENHRDAIDGLFSPSAAATSKVMAIHCASRRANSPQLSGISWLSRSIWRRLSRRTMEAVRAIIVKRRLPALSAARSPNQNRGGREKQVTGRCPERPDAFPPRPLQSLGFHPRYRPPDTLPREAEALECQDLPARQSEIAEAPWTAVRSRSMHCA